MKPTQLKCGMTVARTLLWNRSVFPCKKDQAAESRDLLKAKKQEKAAAKAITVSGDCPLPAEKRLRSCDQSSITISR